MKKTDPSLRIGLGKLAAAQRRGRTTLEGYQAMFLKEIQDTVKSLDENLSPRNSHFKTAVLLLAMMECGDDEDRLVKLTKLSRKFVRLRVDRARVEGIYKDGAIQSQWFDEEHGGIAFWCDVAVAEGLLSRVNEADDASDSVLEADEVG